MGVQGLTTIVNKNEKILFKDKEISKTKLVIDGNSLIYYLYENRYINLKHGGDYNDYADRIKTFFSALRSNQICSYVVMDGGYEIDRRKHETHVRRARERISKSRETSSSEARFAPMLCRITFLAVIEKMKIPFVVCDFEADHDIATLANAFQCPVLSNDSDFFVYDLIKGYIPLDTLSVSESSCIGKVYYAKYMQKVFPGLQIPRLPILAVTLGSDYIKRKNLYKFYSALPDDRSINNLTVIQSKAIRWSISASLDDASSRLEESLPETLRKFVKMSLTMFSDITCFEGFDLVQYFLNKNTNTTDRLKENHRTGKIPVCAQNILNLQEIFLLCEVENIYRKRSIHRSTIRLRKAIYAMLLGTAETNIFEYDRYGGSLVRFKCTSTSTDGVQMPKYIEKIRDNEKIDILCSIFRFENKEVLDKFSGNTKLFVLFLTYWVKHAKPNVDSIYIKSLILCHIVLTARTIVKTKNYQSGNSIDRILLNMHKLCVDELKTLLKRSEKYFLKDSCNFSIGIVHGFSHYQSCFAFGTYLNQLLGCPIPLISPQEVFNGTFLHNIYVRCQNYEDEKVDRKIKTFFQNNESLGKLFDDLVSAVKENVNSTRWKVKRRQQSAKISLFTGDSGTFSFNIFNLLRRDVEA
ncbi:protein asteroid homolog 1-like [Mytilus californianus]|uniref:protein asteroid homolog 1-like n=1 Tax=Mytilus californianus TaxID=6549 RepID=UPI002247079C|nr:protein asteroid homolog 1-like [Mytilus californianus]